VRVDTIEAALERAEGPAAATNRWALPPGYEIGYRLVVDQLRVGVDVIAESVNALKVSRDAWRDAASAAGAKFLEVEVTCSDVAEHRRRAEARTIDVVGLLKPTWSEIVNRQYDEWDRVRVLIDTSTQSVEDSVETISTAIRDGV
jgi:predicted kinase